MSLSVDELHYLSKLAYLEVDKNDEQALAEQISAIIDFADQLKNVNTRNIPPLFHPMHLHQRLRIDENDEQSCLNQLAEIAPLFDNDMYLVPKVIDTDKDDV